MSDLPEERAYNKRTLAKVFFASSAALLVCVVLIAWKEHCRPWKKYARQFARLEKARFEQKQNTLKTQSDAAGQQKLREELKDAEKELQSRAAEIKRLRKEKNALDKEIQKSAVHYQALKNGIDGVRADYARNTLRKGRENPKLKDKIGLMEEETTALNRRLMELNQKRDEDEQKLTELFSRVNGIREKIGENRKELKFTAPEMKIRQVVLENLPHDMTFAKAPRTDRCMTCHLGIGRKGYEDEVQPFRTHPDLEICAGEAGIHPLERFGCAFCHGGAGEALGFNSCGHVPDSLEKAGKWKIRHGWREPAGTDEPMLPAKYTEGYCLRCHSTQTFVNHAPKLNRGQYLLAARGCLGCHQVRDKENPPISAMSLAKVKGKLRKEFVEKWVWAPKSLNAKARMPAFFQQSNTSGPQEAERNKAELLSMVEYLFEHSQFPPPNPPAAPGNAAEGRKLFKAVGCAACHSLDDVDSYHADFAPDLSAAGSKLSAPFLYAWVKNPRRYDPETRMPSLRLSEAEAAHLTEYLSSQRNRIFEKLPAPTADSRVGVELLLENLKPTLAEEEAYQSLARLEDRARTLLLGEKSIAKYGCYGCHAIQGFEKAQRVGSELSAWGRKPIHRLDFGFTRLPRTRLAFINGKLEDPRVFDRGRAVKFQDGLKMPNFQLDDADKEAVVTAVLGLTDDYVPEEMKAGLKHNGPLLEKGKRVLAKFNCRGCHRVEGQGGAVREMYENEGMDVSMAPPDLNRQGAKAQIAWFHDFLLDVRGIRPWLKIRMPSFRWTDEDLSDLVTYFNLKDGQVYPFDTSATRTLAGAEYIQARSLFENMQCQKCHVLAGRVPVDISTAAPDLAKVKKRLKPAWVADYLKNPVELQPGTRMPVFWPDGISPMPQYFQGDSAKQQEALRDYLFMRPEY